VTAFITAMFAASSNDKADDTLGELVKAEFQSRYIRPDMPTTKKVVRFEAGSDGESAVHSAYIEDLTGWGHAARVKRTKVLKALV
jgi:hypothetical protein